MSIELPVLRLGLVGFSAELQQQLTQAIAKAASGSMAWEISEFAEADVWCVNGARSQLLVDGTLRVASGIPSGRSVHLNLPEIDRPVAFSLPLAPRNFEPEYRFDASSVASIAALLTKLEAWLRPMAAQFSLASHIIENESALGAGIYHVSANAALLAVVNLQGEVGVRSTANAIDFEDAMWTPRPASAADIPETFVRASLSQLMWQYAVRTSRDVLPRRYRTGLLYFRRPPRLAQRLLKDAHLLLLRELACAPAAFADLQQRTGMAAEQLSRALGALYLVGAITSNPKRAGASALVPRTADAQDSSGGLQHSIDPSGPDSDPVALAPRKAVKLSDLTAPAPMSWSE